MACLFFVIGLNLFGVFELGSLWRKSSNSRSSGNWGSFSSGVLATIVATPCTAPFMGSALGFAVAQPAAVSFMIFTSLGLGMASPYLVLTRFPRLLRLVPKPGPWMMILKQFLGFFLMATVIWLTWVLGIDQGAQAVAILLVGLLILGIAVWIYGVGSGGLASRKFWVTMVSVVLFGIGLKIGLGAAEVGSVPGKHARPLMAWQTFSREKAKVLLKSGHPVFIDFTAKWCLTCQVNERIALENPRVIERFNDLEIVALKADWTNYDEEIALALKEYGKNSIPLYVFHLPGEDQPRFLPELLTPDIVHGALNDIEAKIDGKRNRAL